MCCMIVPKNIKQKDEDITDEEIEKVHVPFNNNLDEYMIRYVIAEVVTFQIANSYYRNCLCSSSFEQHFNSFKDVFNVTVSLNELKKEIIDLLRIKYNLKVIKENPLVLDKWK